MAENEPHIIHTFYRLVPTHLLIFAHNHRNQHNDKDLCEPHETIRVGYSKAQHLEWNGKQIHCKTHICRMIRKMRPFYIVKKQWWYHIQHKSPGNIRGIIHKIFAEDAKFARDRYCKRCHKETGDRYQ